MGFFGDLGNIFHSIGQFFAGGGNSHPITNPQPQPPAQPVVHPILTGGAAVPSFNTFQQNQNQQPTPRPQPQPQQTPLPVQQPTPFYNLYQGPTPGADPFYHGPTPPQPLAKMNPQAPAPMQPNGNTQPHPTITQNLIDAGKDVAGVVPGVALGTLRTVEDAARGVVDTPAAIANGITWAGDQLSGVKNYQPRLVKAINDATNTIDSPLRAMQDETDKAAQGYGQVANALYQPAHIASTVATLIPAGAEALTKVGQLGSVADKIPTLLKGANAVNDFMDAQRAASPTVAALSKVKANMASSLQKELSPATDTAAVTSEKAPDEIAVGIKPTHPPEPTVPTEQSGQPATHIAPSPAGEPLPAGIPTTQTELPPQGPPAPPAESPVPPVENQEHLSSSNNVPQEPTPVNRGAATAPNAPNIRAQAQKDLDAIGNQVDKQTANEIGSVKEHDVLSNQDLNDAAQRYAQSMSDDQLKQSVEQGMTVNGAGDIAKAYAVVKRLGQMAANGDEEARQLIPGILDSVEGHVSGAGRSLNYTGSMLDSLPKEAQQEYLIKSINRSRTSNGLEPLSDAEEQAARDTLNKYLTEIEQKRDAAAGAKGSIDEIMARAEKGEATPEEIKAIADYQRIAEDSTREANQLNTQVGKEYAQMTGAKGNWARSSGEVARGLMLTKPTGRMSDIITTGINGVHSLTQNTIENGIGKVLNKTGLFGGAPGKYSDTLPNLKAMARGTGQGTRDLAASYKGNVETPDLYTAIKGGGPTGKARLVTPYTGTRVSQVIRNTGHAFAETATNLSKGIGTNKMYQMAMQEAKQMGLEGEQAKIWAAGRVSNPTPAMQRAGQQVIDEVNNMNDNPFSDAMNKVSRAFSTTKVGQAFDNTKFGRLGEFAGEQIKNIIAPFTHWAATAAWNGATDKNVIANGIKIARAVQKGDPQEVVHQIAGLVTNAGAAATVGYGMAQAGLLTTHNAEGYDDEGLYIHLGSHYIPAGFIGFFAPGMVMGWATHQAMTDNGPGSMMDKIARAATGALMATLKADMGNTVIGGNNEFITQLQNMLQNKENVTPTDVAVTAATDAAGSYAPGIFGDMNTGLNLSPLNPTHEAALTKVTKGETGQMTPSGNAPSTAKDIPLTDVNTLLNKLPGVSQLALPRNPGVAANDFISNVTRGDNESPDQAAENRAIDQFPQAQQQTVRTALSKVNGAAQLEAQRAADAMPAGPNKVKAQQAADKLAATARQGALGTVLTKAQNGQTKTDFAQSNQQLQTIGNKTYANIDGKISSFDTPQKAQTALDKQAFTDSGKPTATINGKTWAVVNGTPKAFDTPLRAQQAVDLQNFKAGKQAEQHVNGMVYLRGSDGKVTSMEQKDYDYKQASDQMTSAKDSGDVSSYTKGAQDLLGNISWQLQHADLTPENRDRLAQKAASIQHEYAQTQQYGGFTKPKGATSYAAPQITGVKQYTPDEQQQNGGYKNYTQVIQTMGAKYGLDINALLSVAAQEGLGGGVGDGGHAFGPFQMNDAGGVLTGKFANPAEARAYAESPQGIEDAIKQIAAVAQGKTGPEAIKAIVYGFERPANPEREYQNALALYSGGKATLSAPGADGSGGTGVASLAPSDASSAAASKAASLVRENKIGSLPALQRESFINDLAVRPVPLNIPQVKLTAPETLIKAHKITVGMPRA